MKPVWLLIAWLLLAGAAYAQVPQGGIAIHGRGQTASGDAISVRCRDITDTSFEACGGGGAGGGDGAINDGVSSSIKATVFDRTNSNPLATQLVDSNGDPVSVGGGTQYGQGSAATDTDQLMMAGCVRADTAAVATGVADGDRARCIVDATGRMWVHVGTIDGGTITGITNPVAVTQSGAWTNVGVTGPLTDAQLRATPVPVSGTLTVTDGAGALNVIVDSSALPSGAATAANQDGIIRDGTGDTTQANVSSGRLHVDGSGVTQPISGSVTANAGTNLNTSALALDATLTGRLPAGASPADNESNTNTSLSRIGTFNYVFDGTTWDRWTGAVTQSGSNWSSNVAQFGGSAVATGTGAGGAGIPRVTISNDSSLAANQSVNVAQLGSSNIQNASNGLNTAGTGLGTQALAGQCDDTTPTALTENQFGHVRVDCANHALKVDHLSIAGTTVATGNGTVSAGVQRVAIASDNTAFTVNSNPGTAANWGIYVEDAGETAGGNLAMSGAVRRDTLASSSGTSGDNSTINTTADGALWVAPVAATNGGTSTSRLVSAATTNATNLKASAGQVYAIIASNVNAAARYIHLYNTAGTPTCNASIINTFIIPGNTAGAGTNISIPPGVAFGTGIGYCITTSVDGTGSVAASEIVANFFFR